MLDSICDLADARPHMHKTARFTPPELRAYTEGYYWGVTMALRVALEAARVFELFAKLRRAAARRESERVTGLMEKPQREADVESANRALRQSR